jgi:hypothetical protein
MGDTSSGAIGSQHPQHLVRRRQQKRSQVHASRVVRGLPQADDLA